jgi:hypothetical protein
MRDLLVAKNLKRDCMKGCDIDCLVYQTCFILVEKKWLFFLMLLLKVKILDSEI